MHPPLSLNSSPLRFEADKEGDAALYVRESLDCLEFNDGDNRVEWLWVRIRGKARRADTMVGVCHRPPNQDEEAHKMVCKQLGEVSGLLVPVLMGDFNLPNVFWKYSDKQAVSKVPGVWQKTSRHS